jgi:hypothetical protein
MMLMGSWTDGLNACLEPMLGGLRPPSHVCSFDALAARVPSFDLDFALTDMAFNGGVVSALKIDSRPGDGPKCLQAESSPT